MFQRVAFMWTSQKKFRKWMCVCVWGGVLRQVDMIARQLADFDYIG